MIALPQLRTRLLIAALLAVGVLSIGAVLMWKSQRLPATLAARELLRGDLVLQDGKLYARGEREPFTGKVIESYSASRRKLEIEINDGGAHGLSRGWFDNGNLEVEETFLNGVSHGPRTRWHRDGKRKSLAHIRSGKVEDEFLEWHDNGQLATRMTLHEGKPVALVEAWHPSGALKSRIRFENGRQVDSQFFDDTLKIAEVRSQSTEEK